jgi:hypothetical protein
VTLVQVRVANVSWDRYTPSLCACLLLLWANAASAQKESLLEKLYRLVWPLGHYDGNLAS